MRTNGKTFLSERQFSNLKYKHEQGELPDFNSEEWHKVIFINHLKNFCDQHNLTLRQFSNHLEKCGFFYNYQYIQKVMKGDITPSHDFMIALQLSFEDASIDEIFYFDGNCFIDIPGKKLKKIKRKKLNPEEVVSRSTNKK